MTYHLRAVNPNGSHAAFLPDVDNAKLNIAFSDVGSVEFEYALQGQDAALVVDQREIAIYNDNVEIPDTRFVIEGGNGQRVAPQGVVMRSWSGRTLWKLLDESLAYTALWSWPIVLVGTVTPITFTAATPGAIVRTLIEKAQTFGELPGLTMNFGSGYTSSGAGWANVITIEYEMGVNLLQVVQNLVDQGLVEVRLVGRQLQMYNPGTLGTDRTVGANPITLWANRNTLEAPEQTESSGIRNVALVRGENDTMVEVKDTTSVAKYGRRPVYVSQGGVKDVGTLNIIGQATVDRLKEVRHELTYKYVPGDGVPIPMTDFIPGDWVYTDMTGVLQKVRVRQILIEWGADDQVTFTLVLNDKFLENEIMLNRRVEGITNGATAGGGSSAIPNTDSRDKTIPIAPTGLLLTSDVYTDLAGRTFALFIASWAQVVQNTDGTSAEDITSYQASWRYSTDVAGQTRPLLRTTTTSVTKSTLLPGKQVYVKVRAVDEAGHTSAWSSEVAITLANDITPPPVASTPILTTPFAGSVRIRWDGLGSAGEAMPGDFLNVEVHWSTVNNFTPTTATLYERLGGPGITNISGLSYDAPIFVKFVAQDQHRNKAAASAQASATPVKVSSADLANGIIGYDAIGFKQLGNTLPDGSFEDVYYNAALAITSHSTAISTSGFGPKSGTNGLLSSGDQLTGTFRYALLMADRGIAIPGNPTVAGTLTPTAFRVQPDERWLFRVAAKVWFNQPNGNWAMGLLYFDKLGAPVTSDFLLTTTGASMSGLWQTYSIRGTIPANAIYAVPFIRLNSDMTLGNLQFDEAEIRPIVGTLLIDDTAIVSAHIANLAVTDAKIASASVGKLTAGTLQSDVTVSARIKTANTGARIEFNNQGIKGYDALGNLSIDLNATTGYGTISGTFRTEFSGTRLELGNFEGSPRLRLFTGDPQETAPAYLYTQFDPSGSTGLARVVLRSPSRNGLGTSQLELHSRDADTGADVVFSYGNGSVYWNASVGYGAHYYKTGSSGWMNIYPDEHPTRGRGAILQSLTGDMNLYADNGLNLWAVKNEITVDAKTTLNMYSRGGHITIWAVRGGSDRIKLIGYLDHSGGNLLMNDDFGVVRFAGATDSTSSYIQSDVAYNRLYSSAANMFITSSGTIGRSISLSTHKVAIADAPHTMLDQVKRLRPVTFFDKGNAERYATLVTKTHEDGIVTGDEADLLRDAEFPRPILGLLAEEVNELGIDPLLQYDGEGQLTGLAYDRIAIALIPWLQELTEEVKKLRERQ